MPLELYSGQMDNTARFNRRGYIYISTKIGIFMDPEEPYLKIHYDRETRLMTLTPASERGLGTRKWSRPWSSKGTMAIQFTARSALYWFGILPEKTVYYAVEWKDDAIHIDLSREVGTVNPK